MTAMCVPLGALTCDDLPVAGGKGANLGELTRAGFPVPEGFVVTTHAYRTARDAGRRPGDTPGTTAAMPVPSEVARAVLAAYARLGGGPVAVRSSATAEDLPGATFAGQHDTSLNVIGPPALLEAVRDCWASAWTDRAVAYRARLDVPDDAVAVAVVVQAMVPAQWAGVMFTANPVTGARDEVVIESSAGLGESVVSGSVTPDHVVLAADGSTIEHRPGGGEAIVRPLPGGGTETVAGGGPTRPMDPWLLARLGALGRAVALHFGTPQDIEWAVTGADIHLLQARPMTALPPAPVRLNRVQRFIGPVIHELLPRRPLPMELTGWTCGVVLPHVERLLDAVAGLRLPVATILPAEDAILQAFVPPTPRPGPRTPARLLRSFGRAVRYRPGAWIHDPRNAAVRARSETLADLDVRHATWGELVAAQDEARAISLELADLRARYLASAGLSIGLLTALVALLGRDEPIADLLGGADTQTMQANRALAGLAEAVRALPALREAFATMPSEELVRLVAEDPSASIVRDRLAAFESRFGHRETAGVLMLKDPSWGDSPSAVLGLVRVLLTGAEVAAESAPMVADPAGQGPAGRADAPFLASRPPALERLLDAPRVRRFHARRPLEALAHTVSAGIAMREDTHFELTRVMPAMRRVVVELGRRLASTGALERADDVWFLTWDEVAALPGPDAATPQDRSGSGGTLRADVARRKSAYAALAGSPLIAASTLYPRHPDAAGALLSGLPGGGGRRAGVVRVIQHPDEFALLSAGEVLVCPATNPSWTPLFARAAALVVDRGGPASHAAIVAREYGLPSVLATGTGTSILVEGQRVVVDGDRGLVLPAGSGGPG